MVRCSFTESECPSSPVSGQLPPGFLEKYWSLGHIGRLKNLAFSATNGGCHSGSNADTPSARGRVRKALSDTSPSQLFASELPPGGAAHWENWVS